MFASESYRNCLETERLLMKDIRNTEVSARDRAVCANALDRILERKRILRNRPKVRDVDFRNLSKLAKPRTRSNDPDFIEADTLTEDAGG
jgi:hypothetical protein